jgi:two-component system, LytTR family, response regulator
MNMSWNPSGSNQPSFAEGNASLKVLIVDDELHSRLTIRSLLMDQFPRMELVGMASNCVEARKLIVLHDPDLVLLDISMPGETGFDLLYALPDRRFQVVFVTAHEQFAVRAFRASAVDYLLKPVDVEDFKVAVAKAQAALYLSSAYNHQAANLEQLYESLKAKRIDRLALPHQQGVDMVEFKEIQYLEADVNYTRFHIQGGRKLVACHPLKHYEEVMEPEGFFRVHRSFMINMAHLRQYIQNPTMEAILKDGTRLEVSRRRAPSFHEEVLKWKLV